MTTLRPAATSDLPAIHAIYARHVLHGLGSFEEVPPALEEMRRRYEDVTARGLPYIVACDGGDLLGYGYCTPYRARTAYRFTLEDSIYVREGMGRRGLGRAVLAELVARGDALGYRQMIAVIGDSANAASIRLHAAMGFLHAGMLRSSGYKFGRWVDSVLMQRPLGRGDGTPPQEIS